MSLETTKQQDAQYLMHTYARFPAALVRGENATAWDEDGKAYIDFTSGIGVNALGYADPAWAAAVAKQAGTLQHISNLYLRPVTIETAALLCKVSGMQRVFFANSGAEANEGAIKLARKYGTDHYGERHCKIVTLKNSFHGRTVTTLAATGQDAFHHHFTPFTEGFSYAEPAMESVKAAVDEDTCAVFIELIQGEGGVHPLDPAFIKALRDFCTERDVLLLVDEVQTGIGRTGSFFCYEQYGIKPDVVSAAKALGGGLPIGAVLANEKCADVLGPGDHGSTFGGNPVACAGAQVIIRRVSDPAFLQAVREKGAFLRAALEKMPQIESVRGLGLMLGAKPAVSTPGELAQKCCEAGLLVLTAKDVLRFLPPLTITKEELQKGLAILAHVLQDA